MALALSPGLTPPEIAFLCEMELVTVIPRQRLDSLPLLGGTTPLLRPPHRSSLPLWLALLLKRQRRASIVPPPWLHPASLTSILDREIGPKATTISDSQSQSQAQAQAQPPLSAGALHMLPPFTATMPLPLMGDLTPPFQPTSTAPAAAFNEEEPTLPYHYLELSHLLLTHASDDIPDPSSVTRLLRDIREVRLSKLRGLTMKLDGGAGVDVSGIGALELGEGRGFLGGVVEGLRGLGGSREVARRERAEEGGAGVGEEDEDMEL